MREGHAETQAAAELLRTLLASRVLGEGDVTAFVASGGFTLNTDENRYLEYASARYNVSRVDHARENLRILRGAASETPFWPPEVEEATRPPP